MSRLSVLIADDSLEWRETIAGVLRTEYEIAGFVVNGTEVVATAIVCRPDAVTLDVSMPGISGLNFCQVCGWHFLTRVSS